MPKREKLGARAKPGRIKTGLSRAVLLSLSEAKEPLSIYEILERLNPRSNSVTHGTIWTTLDRARNAGLIRRELRGRTYYYSLTAGGKRRVDWIKGLKVARRLHVVANKEEEE
jgi:DNA-binding PadR family transcriptional regulator